MPPSISSLAYTLPPWLFTTAIALAALAYTPLTIDLLPTPCQPIAFTMGASLLAVAATPYYRTEATTLHNIAGWLAAACATAAVAITHPCALAAWTLFIPFHQASCRTFIAECVCAATLTIALIINYIG